MGQWTPVDSPTCPRIGWTRGYGGPQEGQWTPMESPTCVDVFNDLLCRLGCLGLRESMTASPNYNSPELRVFKLHFGHLVEAIPHPEQLAHELYSQDMISKGVHDEAVKPIARSAYRRSKLISAMESQIMVNPSSLHKFLSVKKGPTFGVPC